MANNKKISELNPMSASIFAAADIFPVVDMSALETMYITKASLFSNPGPIGSNTAGPADFSVLTVGSASVNDFSADTDLGGLSASDTTLPTQLAVKTYVDIAVGNAVQLNIVNTSVDSTSVIGDVMLVASPTDVNIELVPNGTGKIVVYKTSTDSNDINIIPALGSLLDGSPTGTTISYGYSSLEFVCDGTDFYTI
jgi:hypothetical protein